MNRWLRWGYALCLHVIALASLPWFLYQLLFKGKYRKSVKQRLGLGLAEFAPDNRLLIWVHAVSMGEIRAVTPLIKDLQNLESRPRVILSCITETGYQEGQRVGVDRVLYLPFDFSWCVKRLLKRIRPDLVILCETDFWPNFLYEAHKRGAKMALVNGKISDRAFGRFKKLSFFAEPLFKCIDLFCVQNGSYGRYFEALGVAPKQIKVTGNLKLDRQERALSLEEKSAWRRAHGLREEALVLVLGSTHAPEEELLLKKLKEVWRAFPQLQVVLAPRHPERLKEVVQLIDRLQISLSRFSAPPNFAASLLLIDQMGLLMQAYQVADLAFVGGTLAPHVGGHNLIEPSFFGVPVLYGPYTYKQRDFDALMRQYQAGEEVTQENFAEVLTCFLGSAQRRAEYGQRGLELTYHSKGSLAKTLHNLQMLLAGNED